MKNKGLIIILIMVMMLPQIQAYQITQTEMKPVSIAVYGECVGAFFDVAVGQTINTSFIVKNTGMEALNVSVDYKSSDTLGAVDIRIDDTIFTLDKSIAKILDVSLSIEDNSTEAIEITFTITATSISPFNSSNPISAGAVVSTWLEITGKAKTLTITILDQYERAYAGLDVYLIKDLLTYATSKVNDEGWVRFLLASGDYTANIYRKGSLVKSYNIMLTEDTNTTIHIQRMVEIPENTFITFSVLEALLFIGIGYIIRYAEDVMRKKRKKKQM